MMRANMLHNLAMLLAVAGGLLCAPGAVRAEQQEAVPSPEQVQAIIRYDFGQSRRALAAVEEQVRRADPAQYPAIEAGLVQVLRTPDATHAGKKFVCDVLRRIGSARCVPALAEMLPDPELSHLARSALQGLPCPEAGEALRAALGEISGDLRIGVVGSIGQRGDREAVPALAALIGSEDEDLGAAALSALGQIGGAEAAGALAGAEVPPALEARWADACLGCAEGMLAEGRRDEASAAYRRLFDGSRVLLVRVAALRGIVRAEGQAAVPLVLAALKGEDPELQRAAAKLVVEVPGEQATGAFARELAALPPGAQVVLLGALAERADRSAAPQVARAAQAADEAVRVAALRALGVLGTPDSVEVLASAAASGGAAGEAASASLEQLSGEGVDEAVMALIPAAGDEVRRVLIRSLAARGCARAVPMLTALAREASESVRVESLKALGRLAGEGDLAKLVALLLGAGDAGARPAEDAIAAVAQRAGDPARCAGPVLAALPGPNADARRSLLRVLGRIGGPPALEAVRAALDDDDEGVRDAAVRSLADWPDASAAPALIELARAAPNQVHRVLALRGYVRAAGLPSDRPPAETVDMLRTAMEAAARPEERRLVLSAAAQVCHLSALEFAEACLGDAALAAEAQTACVQIASAVSGANAEEAVRALEAVRSAAVSDGLRRQADDALRAIRERGDYIGGWMVSGPYVLEDADAGALLRAEFPPERPGAADVRWRLAPALTNLSAPWLVELDKILGGQDRCAYLRTEVYSPARRPARLEIGSDDGVKAWLNGRVVHENNAFRPTTPGEDKVDVVLEEGWNALVLKVTQGGGEWSACARFTGRDGSRLEGLRVRAE